MRAGAENVDISMGKGKFDWNEITATVGRLGAVYIGCWRVKTLYTINIGKKSCIWKI